MGGVQYVIISSYGLHIGHNSTNIRRQVVDSIVEYIVIEFQFNH